MATQPKFNYKKVLQLLMKEEQALKQVQIFLKSIAELQIETNMKALSGFSKLNEEVRTQLQNKQLIKSIVNFGIQKNELECSEANIKTINEKLLGGVLQSLKKIVALRQKARTMQQLKNTLTVKEVQSYRDFLKEQMVGISKLRESVLQSYAHNSMKNNCRYLQELTNLMQQQKSNK